MAAVLADWRSAPISEPLRATLGLVRTLTLEPDSLGRGDLEAVRAAGASEEAILDAIYICGAFSILTRIADAFGAVPVSELLAPELRAGHASAFLARGYAPPPAR